jgi:hypothetical protein
MYILSLISAICILLLVPENVSFTFPRNRILSKGSPSLYSLPVISPEDGDYNPFQIHDTSFISCSSPLYTVFWKECPECTELLNIMERNGMRHFFVNAKDLFDDDLEEPIVCKSTVWPNREHDEYKVIGGWFAIYEELYRW